MLNRQLLIILLVTVGLCGVIYATSCEPSCVESAVFGTKKCLPPTTMVEDPMNCTQFYYCLANCEVMQHPVPCEPGNIFDPVAGECATGTDCKASCDPGICHLTCNGTMDMISDPTDCNNYFICFPHGIEGPFHCPADSPYFNGETCVVENSECCEGNCLPFCDTAGVQIPDPTDCTKYYICIKAGEMASEDFHFTCNSGNFDVALGRCSDSAECKVLCPNGLPPDGATTAAGASTADSSVAPTGDCLTSLTCTGTGNFAKCATCQPEYFHCSAAGATGISQMCSGDLVFNPIPSFPYCVLPTNCPYTPPL
ncbi:multiple epidermal growth factor-like domains protein 10 [Penaeus japonicus]|uniref:multiple epidermal growth factor-like domains protein 10 n=1 Tax=Penaeus japonicus TaxID=27405 RepID=UPI001C70C782|nr:multiple epidermal growth factor-like domains protein 10 [Penaeus japonicus]